MVGVAGETIASQLAPNFSAARFGVLEFLDHHHSCALAHDEAVAVAIEGSRGALRFIVPRAQCFHCRKSTEADRDDGGFRAAGEEDVGVAKLDDAPRFPDRIVGGRAGGDDAQVWPAQPNSSR